MKKPRKGFFDSLDEALDTVLGPGKGTDSSKDLEAYDVSLKKILKADAPLGYSPDTTKEFLEGKGYEAPERNNPYTINPSELQSLIADKPSAFNVVDIDTVASQYVDGSSPLVGGTNGFFATPNATLKQIQKMLNVPPQLAASVGGALTFEYLNYMARTIEIKVPSDFMRIERMPAGQTTSEFARLQTSDAPKAAAGVLRDRVASWQNAALGVPDGYIVQAALSNYLTGIFVQFDSTDAPVMRAKPYEVYEVGFTTLYVTFFIFDSRWRVITGQKAKIKDGDDRQMRQSLHIWDGAGIVDGNVYPPVPFTFLRQITFNPSSFTPNVNNIMPLISNHDDGVIATGGASATNGVGLSTNKGYGVLWITGIDLIPADTWTAAQPLVCTLQLCKFTYQPVTGVYTERKNLLTVTQNFNISRGPFTWEFNTPIRVVLAGFDCQPFTFGTIAGFFPTGEILGIKFDVRVVGAVSAYNPIVNIRGYSLGWCQQVPATPSKSTIACVPFNPYPMDTIQSLATAPF